MRRFDPWQRLRFGPISIVFAVALALLLAGQGLTRYLGFQRPLAREIEAMAEVEDFAVRETPEGLAVELSLARVPDLERTAEKVLAAVAAHSRRPVAALIFRDRREGLTGAYYELRFTLEEAMATGRYGELRTELARRAQAHELTRARVYLGRRFLYVQLEKGGAYLYEALPRAGSSARPEGGEA